MPHYIEWSRAYSHRLNAADGAPLQARAAEMGVRLERELAQGILPFLSMPYRATLEKDLPPILEKVRTRKHMLVLGIGGSALGARAIQRAFAPGQDRPGHDGPCLWIADNVCAEEFEALLAGLDAADTSVVCISKSGGTIETLAQYFLVRQWLQAALGEDWQAHMVVVTDAVSGYLRQEATLHGLASLEVPDHLGGRYSVLSAVGLLPAGFLGVDWHALLDGAAGVARPLVETPRSLGRHPSYALACWARALELQEYSELILFCYVPQWAALGPWFAQLWAESLGKDGLGILPVAATGVTDQHSVNQMFLSGPRNKGCIFLTSRGQAAGRAFGQDLPQEWAWLRGKPLGALLEAEALGTRMALCMNEVPLVHMDMDGTGPKAAGAFMLLLEAATLFTGWLMGVNPLDQPAVELGKRLANARLGAPGYAAEHADLDNFMAVPLQEQAF